MSLNACHSCELLLQCGIATSVEEQDLQYVYFLVFHVRNAYLLCEDSQIHMAKDCKGVSVHLHLLCFLIIVKKLLTLQKMFSYFDWTTSGWEKCLRNKRKVLWLPKMYVNLLCHLTDKLSIGKCMIGCHLRKQPDNRMKRLVEFKQVHLLFFRCCMFYFVKTCRDGCATPAVFSSTSWIHLYLSNLKKKNPIQL